VQPGAADHRGEAAAVGESHRGRDDRQLAALGAHAFAGGAGAGAAQGSERESEEADEERLAIHGRIMT
jgi:hypothetical protein